MKLLATILASVLLASCDADHSDHQDYHAVWYNRKSLPAPRSDMTATVVGDAVYLIGGCASNQGYVSIAKYENFTGGNATEDNFYTGYYCGGFDGPGATNATSSFSPRTNTHKTLRDAPRARYRHAAAAVGSKIYVFGGTDDMDASLSEVDVFDTKTEVWTTLAQPMSYPYNDLAAVEHEGVIYAIGGYNTSNGYEASKRIQALNVDTGEWVTKGELKEARGDCGATVLGRYAYVVGGFTHVDEWAMPLETVEKINLHSLFHLRDFTVAEVEPLAVGRGDKAVAALHGAVHVMGGETKTAAGASEPLTDVEVYDEEETLWRVGGEIPAHRFRFVAAAFDDSIFMFGGQKYLVGAVNADGSYYAVANTVVEYREVAWEGSSDGHVEDHDHDNTALAAGALVVGILALCVGVVALVVATRKKNEEDGMSSCVPVPHSKNSCVNGNVCHTDSTVREAELASNSV